MFRQHSIGGPAPDGLARPLAVLFIAILGPALPAAADITAAQVLVVYNSVAPDATVLKDAYLAVHPDIPAENVFDINDPALIVSDLTRAQFVSLVRDPIRSYLNQSGPPTPAGIVAIVLIRPFPHRLLDSDAGAIGDNPAAASSEFYPGGDATYSSLDADLVLLWQNLDTGEAGGMMDSKADNIIDNPYHQSATAIGSYTRSYIQTQKTFTNWGNVAWTLGGSGSTRLTPGDMYLVCRIDGTTLADAEASITRAQNLYVNKALVKVILDEYDETIAGGLDDDYLSSTSDPFYAGDDYEEARTLLQANGWNVRYDDTFDFIDGPEETAPIIAYASYGVNHVQGGAGEAPAAGAAYIEGFHFPPGAIFNTIESFNGRALNGLSAFGQEQAADFIASGGTFAIGHVFEPFSFSIPDNEFLFTRMLVQHWTWGEAAYASLPCLSWQHVVLGDPLGKMTVLNDPGLPQGDLNGDGNANGLDIALFTQMIVNGLAGYRAAYPTLDPIARADFTGDYQITLEDVPGFVAALIGP